MSTLLEKHIVELLQERNEKAISLLGQIETLSDPGRNLKAEALFEKARLSRRIAGSSAVSPIYFSVITQYPHPLGSS